MLMLGLLSWQLGSPASVVASDDGHGAKSHAEAEPGAPMDFVGDLAIWSLVTFVAYILVLKKAAWGPLIQGLDTREGRMKQQLADAEAARVKAEAMLAEIGRASCRERV